MNAHENTNPTPQELPPPAQPVTPPAYPQYPAPPVVAQPPLPGAVPNRRSPGLAVVLSFLPGLGHLYLGLYARALAVFMAFFVAIQLADIGSFGVAVPFVWFFALIDAYRQAQLINSGQVTDVGKDEAFKTMGRGNLGFGIFLLLAGSLLLYDRFYPIDWYFLENWWPALIILAGVYLVARAVLDTQRRKEAQRAAEEDTYS